MPMDYTLDTALPILERTPCVLDTLLRGLPDQWIGSNEGGESWSPFDVVGHLVNGERTNWMVRAEHLRTHGERVVFPPFDRNAQFEASRGKSLPELLDTFAALRQDNITRLRDWHLTAADLGQTGRHPEFGAVRLDQLLATWVAHDLDHLMQITRVLGWQYADAVGPWRAYLRIARPADR